MRGLAEGFVKEKTLSKTQVISYRLLLLAGSVLAVRFLRFVFVLLCVGYKMKKRVGAIEEFEFLPLTEGKQLHITIAITGWLCAGKYGKSKMKKLRGAWTVSVSKSCPILLGRVWLGLMTSTTSTKCLTYLRDRLFILPRIKRKYCFLGICQLMSLLARKLG